MGGHNADEARPVGLVVLMEGADGIRSVDELPEWHRPRCAPDRTCVGRHALCGGTREPGPLTQEGRTLLEGMAELGFVLDLSHMDEAAVLEALDLLRRADRGEPRQLPGAAAGFPDQPALLGPVLRGIIERGGVIGNVPVNSFLKTGWTRKNGSRRDEVPLDTFVAASGSRVPAGGDSLHAGIGSDFDGGFGVQSVPPEIDTVADLQKIVPLLQAAGILPRRMWQTSWASIGLRMLRRRFPDTA